MRKAGMGWVTATAALLWGGPLHAGIDLNADDGTPRLQISGFSDVNFFAQDEAAPGASHSGFRDGQFVLHFASQLAPRLSAFAETTLTLQSQHGSKANVERLIIRYALSDALKFTMGRYHTPINWWNTAYHHGLWLQTTINRPEMIKFGGAFLPVHFLGAIAEGVVPIGPLQLDYRLGVGNGRAADAHDTAGGNGDDDNNRALLASVNVRHDAIYRLNIGASAYSDKISVMLPSADRIKEQITAVHVAWTDERPEFIVEAASVRHESESTGQSWEHTAMYVQLGWRLPWDENRWKPYLRFESINPEAGDPVFLHHGTEPLVVNQVIDMLGLRHDFADYAAAKLELRRQRQKGMDVEGIHVQIAFTF